MKARYRPNPSGAPAWRLRFTGAALAALLSAVPAAAHPPTAPLTHPGWVHPPLLAAPAPPRPVDPPQRMTVRDAQGASLRGSMTAFDDLGFVFKVRGEDRARRLPWTTLDPARVYKIHDRLLERGDGEGWLKLGATLYARGADGVGENALARALRADPALADRAGLARRGQPIGDPAPAADDPSKNNGDAPQDDAPADPGQPTGPVSEGETQAAFWGTLTDAVMTSSTAALRAEVQTARQTLGIDLKVYEQSDYYLFATDIPERDARRWAGLLDRMYHRLCDTFGVARGTNVFRGRGLIYVFRRERDYDRFHRAISNFDARESAGLCRSFGDGRVEISLYAELDEATFSHVLVHEAVHGFLHRYRAAPFVTSWANEGLAEFIAADLVGLYRAPEVRDYVAGVMRRAGGTGDILSDRTIAGWQYPIAQALCDFMIAQDRGRYRDFINAVKDGKPWRRALEEDYGVTQSRLLAAFGRALGHDGLRN